MRRFVLPILALALTAAAAARPFTVVAYNVENLVDADGIAGFEEYQPPRYTRAHTLTKLQNIARVVAQFEQGRGPDILVLAEVEVDHMPAARAVSCEDLLARYAGMKLEDMLGSRFDRAIGDLPAEVLLAKAFADRGLTGYKVVAADNVAVSGTARPLEQKNVVFTRFPVRAVRSHPTLDARAILELELDVDGAPLHVFANHWKSGASDPVTEATRRENARTLRRRLDEILHADPNADIILGGDFNSQYDQRRRYPAMKQTGLNDILGSQGNELAVRRPDRDLYNLWYELPAGQRGSDTFRGEWGTLMHLIISRGLYDFRGVQYVDNSFSVAKFTGLNADEKGLPVRWSADGPAGSGFSDHFPVAAKFTVVNENRPDRWLSLRRPSQESAMAEAAPKIGYDKMDLPRLALTAATLPPGASIQSQDYKGKIFRVEGRVTPAERLAVEFRGEVFDVWSYDAELRGRLRAENSAGATMRFYGELGQYRGRWQFVIQDPGWLK